MIVTFHSRWSFFLNKEIGLFFFSHSPAQSQMVELFYPRNLGGMLLHSFWWLHFVPLVTFSAKNVGRVDFVSSFLCSWKVSSIGYTQYSSSELWWLGRTLNCPYCSIFKYRKHKNNKTTIIEFPLLNRDSIGWLGEFSFLDWFETSHWFFSSLSAFPFSWPRRRAGENEEQTCAALDIPPPPRLNIHYSVCVCVCL